MAQEDHRSEKTRRTLKQALISVLQTKTFDEILVKDICLSAHVSRVTFYNYYNDKIALLKDIFIDMENSLDSRLAQKSVNFSEKQPPADVFAEMISNFAETNSEMHLTFSDMELTGNSLLLSMYFHFLVRNTTAILKKLENILKPNYPLDRLSVFIVFGLYGYLRCNGADKNENQNEIIKSAKHLAADLLNSSLFHLKKHEQSDAFTKMARIAGAVGTRQ